MTDPDTRFSFIKRVAALEVVTAELKIALAEFNTIVSPQGWISEAFELMEQDYQTKFDALEAEVKANGQKLDLILQHLTGLTEDPESKDD